MKTGTIIKSTLMALLLLTPFLLLSACSKTNPGTPDPSPPSNFNPADFKITIKELVEPSQPYTGDGYIGIDYFVTNISGTSYTDQLYVHWKVRASDGAYYEKTDAIQIIGTINPGGSVSSYFPISFGQTGVTADKSTLTYTVSNQD